MPTNSQAATNLPITACTVLIGWVIRNSMVPDLRSSAHSRMPTAGTRNR